jgi:hypothetical protein
MSAMWASARRRFGAVIAVAVVIALAAIGCGGSSSEKSKDKTKASGGKAEVQEFLDELDEAVRTSNVDFRLARLHPVVIDRYGEQQCRDFLASPEAQDPSRKDKVKRVDRPAAFEFTTDDGNIPIPDAQFVLVSETYRKKKSQRELHVARFDGEYRYFIDCGVPLQRQ